jgi:hypothetical protein
VIRLSLIALALVFSAVTVGAAFVPSAEAQTQKKAEKKKKPEKKKAKRKGRSDYTAEERKKIMERARKVCRDSQGAPSRVYRIDYQKMVVYCTTASAG